jgi:hypothetical protein
MAKLVVLYKRPGDLANFADGGAELYFFDTNECERGTTGTQSPDVGWKEFDRVPNRRRR